MILYTIIKIIAKLLLYSNIVKAGSVKFITNRSYNLKYIESNQKSSQIVSDFSILIKISNFIKYI